MTPPEDPRRSDAPGAPDTSDAAEGRPEAPARRSAPRWALLPLILVVAFGALAWAMLGRDKETLPSALLDRPIPETTLPPLVAGKPGLEPALLRAPGAKLVNVWASWCGPCRVEHADLMRLAARGAPIHGLNYKDSPGNARAFLAELGDPYAAIGQDENGRAGIEWGVYGVPETFVIDGEGRIVLKHVGPIQNDDLEAKILPALRAAGWSDPEG